MLIQPPGEPREQHLGDVRATQNFIKDKNDRKGQYTPAHF